MIPDRLRRVGLGTRIAMTITVAIVLIQALNVAVFFLLPRPTERIYSSMWLAERAQEAADLFKIAPDNRTAAADALSSAHSLHIDVVPRSERSNNQEPPAPQGVVQPISLQHLRAVILLKLGTPTDIDLKVERLPRPPPFAMEPPPPHFKAPKMIPDTFRPEALNLERAAAAGDRPIWGHFQITLTSRSGDRIVIANERQPPLGWLLGPPGLTGILAIGLVAFLSAWTAKRSLAPLDHLADAARRMGRERVPAPVETRDLGDFAIVGEALNDMQRQIRTFIDDRTQMLGAISHDMKTSLTRLRLSAEELDESESKTALIGAIEDMDEMITATLSFAGDDLAAEPSTQVDVAAIVITCCDTLQDMGAAITYEGADHAAAICQPVALKRAVMNVAENAAKYGGEATVSLSASDTRILITIRDSGPGIPEHLIPEALRPFRRLETSRSRETGGAGLGLAIARDVMSAHGGSLRLENHPEGGLVAFLDLPRTRLAQA